VQSTGSVLSRLLQSASAVLALPLVASDAVASLASASEVDGNPAVGALCRAQMLLEAGQLKEAADVVASATSCAAPVAACTVAILRAAAGDTTGALEALGTCITALRAAAAKAGALSNEAVQQQLFTALLLRAGLHASAAQFAEARADYDAVAALPAVQPEQRAAALASAALLSLQVRWLGCCTACATLFVAATV
jgi:hypothetical protein